MEEKRLISRTNKSTYSDADVGFFSPIIERQNRSILKVDPDDYPNNHLIRVTKGYPRIHPRSFSLYEVVATVSPNWDPETAHENMCKWSTYDKNFKKISTCDVLTIVDGAYPRAIGEDGLEVRSRCSLPSDPFMLRCQDHKGENKLIGPFQIKMESIIFFEGENIAKYSPLDKPLPGEWSRYSGKGLHHAGVFDLDLVADSSIESDDEYDYVVGVLPHLSSSLLDLTSSQQLIKWCKDRLRRSAPTHNVDVQTLQDIINVVDRDQEIPEEVLTQRLERLKRFNQLEGQAESYTDLAHDYLTSTKGTEHIKRYVLSNQNTLMDRYLSDTLNILKSKADAEYKKHISTKDLELAEVRQRIALLEAEAEELDNSIVRDEQKELKRIRDERKLLDDVDTLVKRRVFLTEEIQQLSVDKASAKDLMADIQGSIQKSRNQHTKDLLDLKMNLDALSGYAPSDLKLKANVKRSVDVGAKAIPEQPLSQAKKYVIKKISSELNSQGHAITYDRVAVLLTAIMQNLVVTLAGKPGSGKTSSAINLARSLNLLKQEKFVHVQVQRGWTSDRDLLGFYNKLSRNYEPDRYGLYALLNGLQGENLNDELAFVLLDEANLSPIEHYWSTFFASADKNHVGTFSLESPVGSEEVSLPAGLRFIATVNYDQTTEPLSPRFIDRSPVIMLKDEFSFEIDEVDKVGEVVVDKECTSQVFLYEDLDRLFGRSDDAVFSQNEIDVISTLVNKHRFIPLERRKIEAIKQFTHTLREILGSDGGEALDAALIIHLLPLIQGQGREYGQNIRALIDTLSDYSLTQTGSFLEGIHKASKFDTFSYFS